MIELKEVTSLCGGNLVSCFVLAKALKDIVPSVCCNIDVCSGIIVVIHIPIKYNLVYTCTAAIEGSTAHVQTN